MCKAPAARLSLFTRGDVSFFCLVPLSFPRTCVIARTRFYTSELRAHSYSLFRPRPTPPVYDKAGVPGLFDVTYGRPARVQRQPHSAAPMLSGNGLRIPRQRGFESLLRLAPNLTEAGCGEGAVLPRFRSCVGKSSGGPNDFSLFSPCVPDGCRCHWCYVRKAALVLLHTKAVRCFRRDNLATRPRHVGSTFASCVSMPAICRLSFVCCVSSLTAGNASQRPTLVSNACLAMAS